MKKSVVILIVFISAFSLYAQPKLRDYLCPSFYSTAGAYNNDLSSIGYSGYLLFTVKKFNYVVFGYDNLTISQPSLDYNQQMFVVGEYLNFFPWIISGNFAYVGGGVKSNGKRFPDSEFMNIYNINIKHNINLFYLGLSYTYSNVRGVNTLDIHQGGATLDYYLNTNFSFHLQGFYAHLSDGRDLKSGTITVDVYPVKQWLLSAYRTLGKRAYFFNPDLLTLFNQNETMKGAFGARTVFTIAPELDLIFSYQQYDFTDYLINYYSGGIKFNLSI